MEARSLFTDYSYTNFQIPTLLDNCCPGTHTLVITNISNTLYQPYNTMCGKKWRKYAVTCVKEVFFDRPEYAERVAFAIEKYLTNRIPKVKVFDETAKVIKKLQAQEIPVIAITGKSFNEPYDCDYGRNTYDALELMKIKLFESYQSLGRMEVVNHTLLSYADVKMNFAHFTFFKGIIFTGGKPLDSGVNHFVRNLCRKPKHIVVLQSSTTHKKEFENVANALQIPVTYLSRIREKKSFDPEIGTIQFIERINSGKNLTDEEALNQKNAFVDYKALLKKQIQASAFFFSIRD